jgi:predicted MFS family arabinose efflux permease
MGVAFIGLEGATFATGQFIVPYGESIEGWPIVLAGVVGMLFVFPSFFGGPIGGPVAERHPNHRTQLVVATAISGGVLAALPLVGLAGAIVIGCVFSLAYGFIYAVMYVLPHFWREVPPEEIPLTIGLFNSIQLAGGAFVSYLFGFVVAATSYAIAWPILAALVGATLIALVALPPTASAPLGPPDAGALSPR